VQGYQSHAIIIVQSLLPERPLTLWG